MSHGFSLAHLTVLGCPPPEMVYLAAECGYDYISPRPVYMGLPGEPNYELSKNKDMMRATKQALADTGLKVHDIELFRIMDGRDVSGYEPALEAGAELGAKHLLTSVWSEDKPYYTEQFAKLAELARGYDINVNLEFVTWAAVYDLIGAAELLHSAGGADNIGIMIDTLHFYRSRIQPAELDALPRAWFNFAHLCDGPAEIPERSDTAALIHTGRDERLYVGEGAIDIAEIMRHMPPLVCSLELPHVERVQQYGYTEHARRCLDSVKQYFAKHDIG